MGEIVYFNTIAASTASPAIVPLAITPNRRLEDITELTVLHPQGHSYTLRLYRESGSKPGFYSCDIYRLKRGQWEFVGKDDQKYKHDELPWPPAGSEEKDVRGVRVWTVAPMDATEMRGFAKLISVYCPADRIPRLVTRQGRKWRKDKRPP